MGHPDGDWGSLITMENRKPKKKIGARKKKHPEIIIFTNKKTNRRKQKHTKK